MKNAIAAARPNAGIAAAIIVHVVAIVTAFDSQTHQAIAASRRDTAGNAVIIIGTVAIVAGFKAQFTFYQVGTEYTVSAAGKAAVVATAIVVHRVAVITDLVTFGLGVLQASSDPITATGEFASVGTGIGRHLIPIIAFLLGFDFPVAAFARNVPYDDLLAGAAQRKKESVRQQNSFDHRVPFLIGP